AGTLRIARELKIFFGNVRRGAADLDVGAVRFEHPGHRILALAVASAHPLVLTVSHDSPAATLRCDGLSPSCFLKLSASSSFFASSSGPAPPPARPGIARPSAGSSTKLVMRRLHHAA